MSVDGRKVGQNVSKTSYMAELLDGDLSWTPGRWMVFSALLLWCDESGVTPMSFTDLSQLCHMSRGGVRDALNWLEEVGLIERIRHSRESVNAYALLGWDESTQVPDSGGSPSSETNSVEGVDPGSLVETTYDFFGADQAYAEVLRIWEELAPLKGDPNPSVYPGQYEARRQTLGTLKAKGYHPKEVMDVICRHTSPLEQREEGELPKLTADDVLDLVLRGEPTA